MNQENSTAVRKIFYCRIFILTASALSYVFNYAYARSVHWSLSSLENLPIPSSLNIDRETATTIVNTIINLSLYEVGILSAIIFGNDAMRKILKRACRLLIIFLIVFGHKSSRDVRRKFEENSNELIKVEMFDECHLDELYALQTKLKCCGADNYDDFNKYGTSSCFKKGSTTCQLPFSCFKAEAFQNPSFDIEHGKYDLTATWKNGNIEKVAEVIYDKGCFERLKETFDRKSHNILVFSLIAASVQTLLFQLISHFLDQIELEENLQNMHDD